MVKGQHMSEPRLTDVLWIASRLKRPPFELNHSWACLHTIRQIARAIRKGTYPHRLEANAEAFAYGKHYLRRSRKVFDIDPVLARMAEEAARAEVLWLPDPVALDDIADWIEHVAVADPRLWNKIMHMGFDEIDRRRREWHLSMRHDEEVRAQAAVVVHVYEDGWSWHHLKSKADRMAEGRAMQHCVGDAGFDGLDVTSGVFALRDPDGRSVCTALLHGTWVAQCYGPRNSHPLPETIRRVDELRFHLGDNLSAGAPVWTADGDWPTGWRPETGPSEPATRTDLGV